MPFLDTNVILRHLLNDHPALSPQCKALIQAIERGKQTVWTTDLVIAEIVFVLSSRRTYNVDRETIRDILLPIINLPGIKLANKRLYSRVFSLYTTYPIDYIDAYHAALLENRKDLEIFSYDSDFDRIQGLQRLEPS